MSDRRSGMSLIELLVALSLAMLVAFAGYEIFIRIHQGSGFVYGRTLADEELLKLLGVVKGQWQRRIRFQSTAPESGKPYSLLSWPPQTLLPFAPYLTPPYTQAPYNVQPFSAPGAGGCPAIPASPCRGIAIREMIPDPANVGSFLTQRVEYQTVCLPLPLPPARSDAELQAALRFHPCLQCPVDAPVAKVRQRIFQSNTDPVPISEREFPMTAEVGVGAALCARPATDPVNANKLTEMVIESAILFPAGSRRLHRVERRLTLPFHDRSQQVQILPP